MSLIHQKLPHQQNEETGKILMHVQISHLRNSWCLIELTRGPVVHQLTSILVSQQSNSFLIYPIMSINSKSKKKRIILLCKIMNQMHSKDLKPPKIKWKNRNYKKQCKWFKSRISHLLLKKKTMIPKHHPLDCSLEMWSILVRVWVQQRTQSSLEKQLQNKNWC